MDSEPRQGLRFRPRARLMDTLGRELISSERVALVELVKNSYDADATCVVVSISGDVDDSGVLVPGSGCIRVLDDGHGMDECRMLDAWLEPATSFRKNHKHKPGGRRVLGEKGVGRFATAKLGDRLELTSKTDIDDEVHLQLDWQEFRDEAKYLEDVTVDLQIGSTGVFSPGGEAEDLWNSQPADPNTRNRSDRGQGTLVRISQLHSRWTSELVGELRRSLSMLVSPFAHDRGVVDNFRIYIDAPEEFSVHVGEVSSADLLERHHYSLAAEVEETGTATVLLSLKDAPDKELDIDLGNPANEVLQCGPFEVFLYVWDRDPESMRILGEDLGGRKIAKDMLDSTSGVSIYRDGFRVLPYGEKGDDWLGLDARRVQNPTLALSNNQIVGYVLISRDRNPHLVDQSNRERLVESPALADLREAVSTLLRALETERYQLRPRRPKERGHRLLETIDLTPLREAVAEVAPDDLHIQTIVDEAQRELDGHLERVGEALSRYHRLATLGKLIDMVVHDLTQPVYVIKQETSLGIRATKDLSREGLARLERVRKEAVDRLTTIKDQAESVDAIVGRIAPFGGRRRGRPARYVLEQAIQETVALLASMISSAEVEVTLPSSSHEVTIDRTELQQVMVNLIENSVYWLGRSRKNVKRIDISVLHNDDGSLSVIVEDSGPGVTADNVDLIFHPYFTTKPDGGGLGLAIAGEIVEDYYGGSLELLPPGPLGGARFSVTLRKRVA
ncbi:MAG: ATP-binding protein [Acidimicrobiaceae bacterium]|nr:ATP-binding protein [Acidimicrobiaceae bacterium]